MKILIIRLSSLGDIVLTQPVAASLRYHYPAATIDFVTKPQYTELVSLFKEVDTVIEWKNYFDSKSQIQGKKYDIVLDLHKKLSSYLIAKLCSAKRKISYNKKHFLRYAIVHKWTKKSIYSTLDLYYSAFQKISLEPIYQKPRLAAQVKLDLTPLKSLKVAIFPGATYPTKCFPVEKLAALIQLMKQNWNLEIYLNGSKNEKKICGQLYKQIDASSKINLCGKQNLAELVYFVADMDVVISNDSGPMHLAAALGKKQIAFFGSTTTRLGFRPLNDKAIVFQTILPCQPCTLHGRKKCPLNHFKCMENIDINVVMDELRKMI